MADGQVRCGRCHTQFDALERLIEEDEPLVGSGRLPHPATHRAPAANQTPDAAQTADSIGIEEGRAVEEITLEGTRIEISGAHRRMDEDAADTEASQADVEDWVEFDDLDEDTVEVDAPDDSHVEQALHADPEPQQRPALHSQWRDREDADSLELARPTRAPLGSRALRDEPEDSAPVDDLSDLMPRRRPTALVWKLAVLPLALLLVAQIVHHHRAELARHPRLGTPLMHVYQSLGMQLTPEWNLHAYGIKQWGVVMDPSSPGTLRVRASITNNASFAQPYPLLKLVLEDRWGDQVRAREFEPSEYLDPSIAPDRLLGPAQQANATISIVDPGPDAEGFRFDVCLRGKAGPVCAADVPAR